ncbi:MAG: PIN domain-containing protein [Bacteroidales bacterium]|nr:PIN domain-containing protein [Bacteroidales bacterium]
MKFFLDTNVIVDFLTERGDFYEPAAQVVNLADRGEVTLCCSAMSFATVFYLVRPIKGKDKAIELLREFSKITEIIPVTSDIVTLALYSVFNDFEDAIQYFCAQSASADLIVTRNIKDFKHSEIAVKTPAGLF